MATLVSLPTLYRFQLGLKELRLPVVVFWAGEWSGTVATVPDGLLAPLPDEEDSTSMDID